MLPPLFLGTGQGVTMADEPTTEKEVKNLEDLTPDPGNANKGTERGHWMLEQSLRFYGAGRSILADKDGTVIAGSKTLEAAADMGLPVRVVDTDGSELVVVRRTDLDLDGEGEKATRARELAYADNRTSEVGLAWDAGQIVADMEAGVDLTGFFFDNELELLVEGRLHDEDDDIGSSDFDPAPEMELQPYEHYDYIVLMFRNIWDWSRAVDLFGLEKKAFTVYNDKGKVSVRKIGMCRVVDGAKALEVLCRLSSQAEGG